MKRIFSCSKKKVSKPYSAVEIARLMVYMARPQKVYTDVRELDRLLFLAQSYHYLTNRSFLFDDTIYVRDEELYIPAVRKLYHSFGNSYLVQSKQYVEFNEEDPWASKWRYIDVDSYPIEVIKTIDDVIDMVKVHGIPYFVGGFIPTNETVLTPCTIARLFYTL
mgnify:CR=1 FL=1